MIIKNTAEQALRRYGVGIVTAGEWPQHLAACVQTATMPIGELHDALARYFKWAKGSGSIADLLGQCSREEMPAFIVETLANIQQLADPSLIRAEISDDG